MGLIAAGVVVVLVGLTIGIKVLVSHQATSASTCRVAFGTTKYTLGLEQAANATTIAAVGKRLGMPDHAVTIALAAALQESGLRNLPYGDRDSLGLFQQRPSQGWGTPAQIMTPHYAAAAFFQHLARVDGWQSLPVTVAAQSVQRSATPGAYASSEREARALAIAMTGEVPAGLSCGVSDSSTGSSALLSQAMAQELGRAGARGPGVVGSWVERRDLVGRTRFTVPDRLGQLRGADVDVVERRMATAPADRLASRDRPELTTAAAASQPQPGTD